MKNRVPIISPQKTKAPPGLGSAEIQLCPVLGIKTLTVRCNMLWERAPGRSRRLTQSNPSLSPASWRTLPPCGAFPRKEIRPIPPEVRLHVYEDDYVIDEKSTGGVSLVLDAATGAAAFGLAFSARQSGSGFPQTAAASHTPTSAHIGTVPESCLAEGEAATETATWRTLGKFSERGFESRGIQHTKGNGWD